MTFPKMLGICGSKFRNMLGICYANSVALLVEAICVSNRFQKYLVAAGVESKPFHALRPHALNYAKEEDGV